MKQSKIAILASGEGTTAEAVITASAEDLVNFNVGLVVASNEKAGIFERVANLNKKYKINVKCLLATGDNEVEKLLENFQPDLVVLMGYMKKIGPALVQKYGWRNEYVDPPQAMMLNTHPGLLPATKGLYGITVQKYVIDQKMSFGGQTLHIVSENYDEGPVVAEHRVDVLAGDTPEKLFERVKIVEKQYLPKDIQDFIEERRLYLENV